MGPVRFRGGHRRVDLRKPGTVPRHPCSHRAPAVNVEFGTPDLSWRSRRYSRGRQGVQPPARRGDQLLEVRAPRDIYGQHLRVAARGADLFGQCAAPAGAPGASITAAPRPASSRAVGPVASAAWILARATTTIPAATAAAVTFGDTAQAVTWPGHAPARVTTFTATACYEDFRSAIDALDGALGLSRPGAARLLVIISDGQYKDTQHADGQARIARLATAGCGILWLAPTSPATSP